MAFNRLFTAAMTAGTVGSSPGMWCIEVVV
jgi:hypothetical protein